MLAVYDLQRERGFGYAEETGVHRSEKEFKSRN